MTEPKLPRPVFPSAEQDIDAASLMPDTPQTRSPAYRLAYDDHDFLMRDELRPVRLQLEMIKPELIQQENGISSTLVIFGSTRIPDEDTARERLKKAEALAAADSSNAQKKRKVKIAQSILMKSHYYNEARELGRIITQNSQKDQNCELVVITGGGPGIMEAANRGAHDVDGKSIGLNIVLPMEQSPNAYVTPALNFQFHYFAARKMHFLIRAKALVVFPGGFGTFDELFETLTLIQTKKIKPVPVLLFGKQYWQRVMNFQAMVDEGTIDARDLDLFQYVETAEAAWAVINEFYSLSSPPQ